MKEYVEFRVPEHYAKEFLRENIGSNITDSVRKIKIPLESELYKKIGEYSRIVISRDKKNFFYGWNIQRFYSKEELESAKLLQLKIKKTFEPAGIECGTVYDDSSVCDICGSGIQQVTELILNLNNVPKNVDIARTISNEIIVSQELAKILSENKVTGYELPPVHHISIKYSKMSWYQLITNSSVFINPATKTGIEPFDEDKKNEYRCEKGHTIGLNILSELSINQESWKGSDIAATREYFGVNRGLLRTYPLLVISQRLYRLLTTMRLRGFSVEVVNLIP